MKLIFLFTLIMSPLAQAQELFYDSCQVVDSRRADNPYFQYANFGMSCEQLQAAEDSLEIFSLVLMPASIALNSPGVKPILAAELASLGLTLANPAVLSVTVIGAVGISTIYIVLQQSLKECERMEKEQLRQALLLEMARKYGARGSHNPVLTIKK